MKQTPLSRRSLLAGASCALIDPQHGWGQVRHFDSYEAAYSWLTREAYEPVDAR